MVKKSNEEETGGKIWIESLGKEENKKDKEKEFQIENQNKHDLL